jgi:hypothetical protein
MHLYQIVVVGVAAVMLTSGIKEFVRRETGQTWLKLFVRIVVWGGMVVVTVFPKVTAYFADILGMVDNMNAVIMTGFLLVFLLIFKLLSAIEKIEQNISELTRKEALREAQDQISAEKKRLREL